MNRPFTVLGIAGGLNRPNRVVFQLPFLLHDSAAALVCGDKVIAAIEEERLNRIKHTNCFPELAVQACLRKAGITPSEIDCIAYYFSEQFLNYQLAHYFFERQERPAIGDIRTELMSALKGALGEALPVRIEFVDHHLAHAASTFWLSGFDRALVAVIDGMGDNVSTSLYVGEGDALKKLVSLPVASSLGIFYLTVIDTLGFKLFEEYKVMALAPYGDPLRFRSAFRSFYRLLPRGRFEIWSTLAEMTLRELLPRREDDVPQVYKDVAAALQETLETIVTHLLSHYRQETGASHLCLAGGVAHNCKLNGILARSGCFEHIFVQPAAHDAGGALGAALALHQAKRTGWRGLPRMRHVYLGESVGTDDEIRAIALKWRPLIQVRTMADLPGETARMLADGAVIGWAQGASEFGPRALGNRSILADPRPELNREVVNRLVKKREVYRPFAPAVLQEHLDEFFEVPGGMREFPYMTITLAVKSERRHLLGAVTHVDGSARVQTVSRTDNPRFWELIAAFYQVTGVPVLLNTSFNNDVEPIVDSVEDALTCFLTTGLNYLIVGNCLIERHDTAVEAYQRFVPTLPDHVTLAENVTSTEGKSWAIAGVGGRPAQRRVTQDVYGVLSAANGKRTISELLELVPIISSERRRVIEELLLLWERRYLRLRPLEWSVPNSFLEETPGSILTSQQ